MVYFQKTRTVTEFILDLGDRDFSTPSGSKPPVTFNESTARTSQNERLDTSSE